jgi:hypothetical protein
MEKKKPQQIELIALDGKIIGAIMKDERGYFYRPKRTSITKGPRNKWDGEYYARIADLKKSLY